MLGWNEDIKKHLGHCGENVYIGHNVMFARPERVFLGDNVRIDPFTFISCGLKTENYIQICANVIMCGRKDVYLNGWNFVSYGSKLITGSEDFRGHHGPVNDFWGKNKVFEGDIIYQKYSGTCADTIVMPGTVLPEGTVFGAQSFVGKNHKAKEYELWLGNPLKKNSDRNKEMIIEKGIKGIMPSHVIYSSCDSKPSGLSQFWLKEQLRDALGFSGAIFSDDMSMKAAIFSEKNIVTRVNESLIAGCDMVLVCNSPEEVDQLLANLDWDSNEKSLSRLSNMRFNRKKNKSEKKSTGYFDVFFKCLFVCAKDICAKTNTL